MKAEEDNGLVAVIIFIIIVAAIAVFLAIPDHFFLIAVISGIALIPLFWVLIKKDLEEVEPIQTPSSFLAAKTQQQQQNDPTDQAIKATVTIGALAMLLVIAIFGIIWIMTPSGDDNGTPPPTPSTDYHPTEENYLLGAARKMDAGIP